MQWTMAASPRTVTAYLVATLLLLIFLQVVTSPDTITVSRERRFFWPNWLNFGSRHRPCGGPGDCPDHHCSRDPAVIHGHCCGCGRPSDRVPVPCYPDLNCPLNGDQLCSDYDYMMDCCC